MSFGVPYQLNLQGKLLDLSTPQVMGIINVTTDSFFTGSRFISEKEILQQAEKALSEGASVLDIGAYSTRPNATPVSEQEEVERLQVALKAITSHFSDVFLSVDTFRSNVARFAVEHFGVHIINDVSGGSLDNQMFNTVAQLGVVYVLMHMRGTPETMQQMTDYEHITSDIIQYFEKKIAQLVHLGVKDVIVDPGFGFAKTLEQNYEILSKLSYLKELDFPILAGISRKSMIYKLLDISPDDALNGTTVLNTLALINGANILRVHDVKEAVEAVKIVQQYLNPHSK